MLRVVQKVRAKGPWKRFPFWSPLICNERSLAKAHAKIYMFSSMFSADAQKYGFQERTEKSRQTKTHCFCSSCDIKALNILWTYRWILDCNLYWIFFLCKFHESLLNKALVCEFILIVFPRKFRESLLEPWWKTGFSWKLGILNCGLPGS